MGQWLRRIRGVIGLGLLWAAGGAGIGGLIELADNVVPGGLQAVHFVDMWPQTLAILGFRRGVVFAIVLGIAGGRRRFEEFSYAQFAAWGAVAGLVLGAVALARGAGIVFVVITTLLSAIGGLGSLAFARMAERRGFIGARADGAEARLSGSEAGEPLGRPELRAGDGERLAGDARGVGERAARTDRA